MYSARQLHDCETRVCPHTNVKGQVLLLLAREAVRHKVKGPCLHRRADVPAAGLCEAVRGVPDALSRAARVRIRLALHRTLLHQRALLAGT